MMPTPNRHRRKTVQRASSVAILTGLLAIGSSARAQAPAKVNISVDATATGTPIEHVWPFHGCDEINYTTLPEGKSLLGNIVAAHTAPVRVRNHFLLNTGDGTPALKWGSTNVYTEDASGNPVYSWTLTDGIMDTITGAGAFPFVEIAFMPQALSSHPTPYGNSGTTALVRRLAGHDSASSCNERRRLDDIAAADRQQRLHLWCFRPRQVLGQ
jgi:hypothetical protein